MNYINTESFESKKLPTANIIVSGIAGVGKSTLINAIFGKYLAVTGIGRPVTAKIDAYENGGPIKIWDTVGFELEADKTNRTINEISDLIRSKSDNEPLDRIHAIWYCINVESKRFQSAETTFIKQLYDFGLPFIIVLTQCYRKKANSEFENAVREILKEYNMSDIKICQVLALDLEIEFGDEVKNIPAHGLPELSEIMAEKLPEYIERSFVAAQRINKDSKRREATKIIGEYVSKNKESFWNRIPFVQLFTSNGTVKKMFNDISDLYNTSLSVGDVERIFKRTFGLSKIRMSELFLPFVRKNITELKDILQKLGLEDDFDADNFKWTEKSAILVAIAGFTFITAIEVVWDKTTEEQKLNTNEIVEELIKSIKECLAGKSKMNPVKSRRSKTDFDKSDSYDGF